MLSGRYPSDQFVELRPRLVWDRVAGKVRGRDGAPRLAGKSPGTIPDTGLYAVNLAEDGRRVGELDEEMVYETRVGETFVLGASTWRIVDITPSQVIVTPAPGEPGKIAFWKADAPSRPVELGAALGKMVRELRSLDPAAAAQRLRERAGFDDLAIKNLLAYLDDQAAATGIVPDDRNLVVERFRDEVGDWRVCLHTPCGGRVHAPLAFALEARLRERLGVDARALWTDDGIALHLPEVESPPALDELILDPEEVQALVSAQLPASALFAARFRENAARSLLLPKRKPGQRTPLWQQRMRSAGLLRERFPRDTDEAHDLLARLGDLNEDEAVARGVTDEWLRSLEKERRVAALRIAGDTRWIAAEDAGRYREAMGASLPIGLPEVFLEPGPDPLESLLRRYARTHVPFVTSDPAKRWGLPAAAIETGLTRLAAKGHIVAGEFRKVAEGREYCHPEVLRVLRRRSLAALRREIESVPPVALARFL